MGVPNSLWDDFTYSDCMGYYVVVKGCKPVDCYRPLLGGRVHKNDVEGSQIVDLPTNIDNLVQTKQE